MKMSDVKVLFDACVLYPAPLRDLLMHLAITDLFQAKWTNEIHDEWIESVLHKRPDLKRVQLERTRTLMNENVCDCMVENYQYLISALNLPDENDRHVLAAAIKSSCSVIVTYNLKDFPDDDLKQYGIEARHPDKFISHWIDTNPGTICGSIRLLRRSLQHPPKTPIEYLNIVERQSLPQTVAKLREFISVI